MPTQRKTKDGEVWPVRIGNRPQTDITSLEVSSSRPFPPGTPSTLVLSCIQPSDLDCPPSWKMP